MLTSIIFESERFWVAKCMELGVVSQGETKAEAQENLKEAVELFLEDNDEVIPQNPSIENFEIEYAV
ncbi:type II toxin-antitoxin system HicB family antitoxin [Candidatus Gracilibacteria bacterium]|nr:type II toxin-antitoxin system HicB family antitoxin [Candidatus Gracilibacteria bacterium]